MENRWKVEEARSLADEPLSLRVYSTRLLGAEPDLVLKGGGNTSMKRTERDLYGDEHSVLYVKGSGADLDKVTSAGFSAVDGRELQRIVALPRLTDLEMMRALRRARVDPDGPEPSVETLVHGLIPYAFVDHTHADAVVTISNTPDGAERLRALYGDNVLVLPYVMPGVRLAQQVLEATRGLDWGSVTGLVLMHHGLFTFGDDAKASYDRMIEMVTQAEEAIGSVARVAPSPVRDVSAPEDLLQVAAARAVVAEKAGEAFLAQWRTGDELLELASRPEIDRLAGKGPLTPHHVLQTKGFPVVFKDDPVADIEAYVAAYQAYVDARAGPAITRRDPAPRYGIWPGKGVLAFGRSGVELDTVAAIAEHTLRAISLGQALGGWEPLGEDEVFEVEYWEVEQARLKAARNASRQRAFEGRAAVVTGAASGIGRACAAALHDEGAAVVGIDVSEQVDALGEWPSGLGIRCDVTDPAAIEAAIHRTVECFGGIDLVISNAGTFASSRQLADLSLEELQRSLDINFTSHQAVLQATIPFLKLGIEPAVVFMGSKNVPAPGPGAGAYSTAKAALTQLARIAALELGAFGIRVNVIHPNAVFDTGLWSEDVVAERARSYGLSPDEYKRNNLLGAPIGSREVAALAVAVLGPAFARTTGAQIPIDGGNERVI